MGNTTELGVYILGAVALAILAAAGIATGNHLVIACALIASGGAYIGQLGGAMAVAGQFPALSPIINLIGMAVALCAWLFGVLSL